MGYLGEFDSLDEELFSERLDYLGERAVIRPVEAMSAGTGQPLVFPEPATVRLEERSPARPAGLLSTEPFDRFRDTRYRDDREDREDRDRDPVLAIAFAGLLVLVLISTGVVLWWFA